MGAIIKESTTVTLDLPEEQKTKARDQTGQKEDTDEDDEVSVDVCELIESTNTHSLEGEALEGTAQPTATKEGIKKMMKIRFKTTDNQSWQEGTILNRAGKARGKYPNAWNVQLDDGNKLYVDFDRIEQWDEVTAPLTQDVPLSNAEDDAVSVTVDPVIQDTVLEGGDEFQPNETYSVEIDKEQHNAKMKEQKVYTEVEDDGQQCISVRWVMRPKIIGGKVSIKARFVARGYEEDNNFRTDSPNSTKEGLRVVLSVFSSLNWSIKSIDVVTAFLQGKPMKREVYLRPPKKP